METMRRLYLLFLEDQDANFIRDGIAMREHFWSKVIDVKRDFIERSLVSLTPGWSLDLS